MALRKPDATDFLDTDCLSAEFAMMNAPFLAVSAVAEELLGLRTEFAVARLGRSGHLSEGYQF
jgi:hypothetical protein